MSTFEQDITFLSKDFEAGTDKWEMKAVIKRATFNDISRTERSQHKFHFMIMSIFQSFGDDGKGGVKIDGDGVYDLTVKAIETLWVKTDTFTDQDKTEFLNDSAAIFNFGIWLLGEKITPFFQVFMTK